MAAGDNLEITLGAFIGVHDSPDPGEAKKTKLFEAVNCTIPNLRQGSAVLARHGFGGLPTQLGTSIDRTGQCVFEHRRLDQTIDRFTFGGGRMYRWDGAIGASAHTDITPVGVTIHPSNPIFGATLYGLCLFTDENYKPWSFDPTTGTATLIELDTAETEWATKGPIVVRSTRALMIIRRYGSSDITDESDVEIFTETDDPLSTELINGAQNTLVWSKVGDPHTGYIQDGYDYSLTLAQTSDEILGGIVSEEAALIYFRNKGIGYIQGEIGDDWKTSHTKDTASVTEGTDAPAAIISANKKVWFVNMDGAVFRLSVGGGEPQQLYFPMRRALEEHIGVAANRASVARYARAAYHEGYREVWFTIWDRQTIYAFDADTGTFVGTRFINGDDGACVHVDAMGSMRDENNRATFVVLGTRSTSYVAADQGVVWKQKHSEDDMQWLDQPDFSAASYTALVRAVETQWVSSNAARSFRASELEAQLVGSPTRHQVGLRYTTPAGGQSSRIVARSTATVGVKSDTDAVATARWSMGVNAQGGALRFRIDATHADNVRWGVHNMTVTGVITEARRNAP